MAELIRGALRSGATIGVFGLTMGCFGEVGALSTRIPAGSALGTVVAAPHNIILAVGGTLPVTMSATSLAGEPLTRFDSVQYVLKSLTDSVRVTVTHDGMLTGLGSTNTSAVPLNVLVFMNGMVQGDQVLVQVTPTAVSGLSLSIQPPLGDSTKLASGTAKTITPILGNTSTGSSVTGVQLQYDVQPADANRLGVYSDDIRLQGVGTIVRRGRAFLSPPVGRNQIVPYVGEGSAWVYGRVNAYGTLLQDSVQYTFSYPYTGTVATSKTNLAVMTTIDGGLSISPGLTGTITLARGAIITFMNQLDSTDPLTVAYTFDNPAAAAAPATSPSTTGGASGNVTPLTGGQQSRRQFLTPGTYHWTTVTVGGPAPWPGQTFAGTIVIKP